MQFAPADIVQLLSPSGVLVVKGTQNVSTPTTGRDDEFTAFMQAYQDMVFSTAARLCGNDAQAEDVAQEVFLRAYAHFGNLRGNASAGGWLKKVAINLSLNFLGRYRGRWRFFSDLPRRSDVDAAPETEFATPDTLLADLSAEQRRLRVDTALRALPEHQRVPLVLFHFDELSYLEIAKQLHVSIAKVKTDIRRARSALMPLLQSSGAFT